MKDQQLRSTVSWKLGMKMIRLRQAPNPKALSPSERVACLPNIPFSFLVWHLNDLFDTKPQFIVDIRWFVTSAKNPSHSKPTMQSTASCGEILHPPVPQAKPKTKVPATVRSTIQRQRPKRKKRKKRIRRQVCHLWGCSMIFCGNHVWSDAWGWVCLHEFNTPQWRHQVPNAFSLQEKAPKKNVPKKADENQKKAKKAKS